MSFMYINKLHIVLSDFVDNGEMVMIAHVQYPQIDDKWPATLSPEIHRVLREDLGYNGVIITDDMEMGAIGKNFGHKEAAIQALKAGADILMFSSTPTKQADAYNAIVAAVKDGTITEEAINEKVLRVLALKKSMYGR